MSANQRDFVGSFLDWLVGFAWAAGVIAVVLIVIAVMQPVS